MKYSVIVIGDELLIGQVTDTNSGWIAREVSPLGWEASSVKVVADDAGEIKLAMDQAFAVTDVVLMTGGLGPTKDDITKATLCEYFGGEMIYDEVTAQNVLEVVNRRGIKLNEYTRMQAMVPSSCRVIQNEVGTAPIMWFERDGKVAVSMPGVPHEMRTMMQREVIPQLSRRFPDGMHVEHRTLMVSGIIESALAMRLDDFENSLPESLHLAYLPNEGIIRLRLDGRHSDAVVLKNQLDKAVAQLHALLGNLIMCDGDVPLAAILGNELRKQGLTMASAESCTGGNIAHEITRIAGSSEYFTGSVTCYDTKVKINQLGVPQDVVDEYTVVSQPVVEQMVQGVCDLLGCDCSIATSGVAGPGGGTEETPVGTVWMAAKAGNRVVSQVKRFPGDRDRVINRATTEAMLLLLNLLQEE
ncbi:CinA family nicotinamide mononucleotide deamidase-related protein [Sodaliphilus sp.]|uniref:CinA family nicotinamide mononucleotide deamidase-related protein n=1 Tax=Sodaliphilus sp. TaxID=2815818 RepID=UPI00388E7DC7